MLSLSPSEKTYVWCQYEKMALNIHAGADKQGISILCTGIFRYSSISETLQAVEARNESATPRTIVTCSITRLKLQEIHAPLRHYNEWARGDAGLVLSSTQPALQHW